MGGMVLELPSPSSHSQYEQGPEESVMEAEVPSYDADAVVALEVLLIR